MSTEKGVYGVRAGAIVQIREYLHIPGGIIGVVGWYDQGIVAGQESLAGKSEVLLIVAPGRSIVGLQICGNGVIGGIIPGREQSSEGIIAAMLPHGRYQQNEGGQKGRNSFILFHSNFLIGLR